MKKLLIVHCSLLIALAPAAHANFANEVARGIGMSIERTFEAPPAMGELGRDVYQREGAILGGEQYRLHIPTSNYIRIGGGIVPGVVSDVVHSGYAININYGWKLSSFVRAEVGFLHNSFDWQDNAGSATTRQIDAALYFDLIRRQVGRGDVMITRPVVPFFGFGGGIGHFDIENRQVGPSLDLGRDGMFWTPFVVLGVNVPITDLFGIDLTYRYGWIMTDDFGWESGASRNPGFSTVMASVRFNF
ncbi:MAG: hypothetical protein FWC83_01455 [Alphaproteobacteria bacterium]|nr:hypothetical protein [Alphaproteobacteria bacterium]